MLFVIGEQGVSEVEQIEHAVVRDPVVDGAVLAAGNNEAAPTEAGKMVGDLWLRESEPLDKFAHRQLALVAQQLEDAHARRVAETAEVLGNEIGRLRRARKAERSCEL